jgi:hypothetical protein
MGSSDSVLEVKPTEQEIVNCARCVANGKSYVRGLAVFMAVLAVALAVIVWFIEPGSAWIYAGFVIALLIIFAAGIQLFGFSLRCGPCIC